MLQNKKILLGVSGSIAAYKSLLLVRLLIREGATVRVIQTPASRDFVTPLSLSTLSKNPVLSDLSGPEGWTNHVELGRWADLFLIAPLSCNTLAKMAHGLCDNLLLATYLSATCPVWVAPAMDEDMWKHPSTVDNIETLKRYGNRLIPVEKGELASGLVGEGRMAEPDQILSLVQEFFGANGAGSPGTAGVGYSGDPQGSPTQVSSQREGRRAELAGKIALVTAGPTHEAIDPVRFIGNHSSGKMGVAIAGELASRGAWVHLVLGPTSLDSDLPAVTVKHVVSAEEMFEACQEIFPRADLAIMSAAVADFTPLHPAGEKIKKGKDATKGLTLELTRTRDILGTLGQQKKKGQVLVGFALETRDGRAYALDKLRSKNADLIVLNSLENPGAGFGYNTNQVTIFSQDGQEWAYEQKSKQQVAKDIVDRVVNRLYA
ncbi:MAG TPA: bifunctional phosphopantothenoylcysteine decarboxylase/phosphopantothenate synthase [Puia sp.]|nr:bifunctional phosphopantothenoylcysteine decarboxylase/phosphopantothenate synthase [Puia sp.]